jgi:hypothetical protein
LMPSVSSPSGSLPEVRFHKFLVSLWVGSLIRLHGVGVFDEVKPLIPDTVVDTGGLCPYGYMLKCLVFAFSMALLLGVWINIQYTYAASDFAFYSSEITSLISIFITPHVLGILVKQA